MPRKVRQVSKPSRPGMRASSTTMSGMDAASIVKASSPLAASVTWKPRSLSARAVTSRVTSSSSTIRTFGCSRALSSA